MYWFQLISRATFIPLAGQVTLSYLQLDDALSATRLEDGRVKVWIHVADPTSLVQPGSLLDRYS